MNTIKTVVMAAACASLMATAVLAQEAAQPMPQTATHLSKHERETLARLAAPVACGPARSVAASAHGVWMGSSGDDSIVEYPYIETSEGGAWVSPSTFIAPCPGMYSFTVSMATDSYYPCPVSIGTQDDVWIYLTKSSPPYSTTSVIGNGYGAWRGQLAGEVKRGQASYTFDIRLSAGDAIQTKVASDGKVPRCLLFANFTGQREFK